MITSTGEVIQCNNIRLSEELQEDLMRQTGRWNLVSINIVLLMGKHNQKMSP